MINSEALVIGGGPVGQVAALCLHERGASVQVLDAAGERAVRGYACGLHPETLRIFDDLGLMPSILEAAHRIDRLSIRHGANRATAELGALAGKYPYALALRQFDLEEILRHALERRGVEVRRQHTVAQLYRSHDFVTVTGSARHHTDEAPSASAAKPFEFKTHYVVGADGYFSASRRALGVAFNRVRPTRAFAVCEFNADLRGWEREACLAFTPDAVTAFWPLGTELGRITVQVFQDLDEAVTLERLRGLLREHAPWFSPVPEQLCWGAIAPFEHALAHRFGEGRIWLAGDAAHSTSPIGFQSMNRGFCEVRALADVMSAELFARPSGRNPFTRFEQDQQAEWVRLFGLLPGDAASQWHLSEVAPCMPASGEDLDVLLDQLGATATISRPIF